MLELLVTFVMNFIVTIVDFLMSPFLNALFALFPSVGQYVSNIHIFLTMAFTYVSTILQWFLFTPSMFVLLFDYFVIKYSIYVLIVSIKFALNIYNKLKP